MTLYGSSLQAGKMMHLRGPQGCYSLDQQMLAAAPWTGSTGTSCCWHRPAPVCYHQLAARSAALQAALLLHLRVQEQVFPSQSPAVAVPEAAVRQPACGLACCWLGTWVLPCLSSCWECCPPPSWQSAPLPPANATTAVSIAKADGSRKWITAGKTVGITCQFVLHA